MKQLNSADFDASIAKEKVALVDFFAPWCGPCRMLEPILADISTEMGDNAPIFKVNVDEAQDIAAKFGVFSIPTMIFFKGGKVADVASGILSKDAIKDKLKALSR